MEPIKVFIGKSRECEMTEMSGALDKSVFDGNTNLLKISEENNRHRYVYIGGNMVCIFLTNDKIYEFISKMGNNLVPYSIAIGTRYIYFLTPHFKIIKRERLIIGICWKQMKILLIHMIIIIHNVEKTRLKI